MATFGGKWRFCSPQRLINQRPHLRSIESSGILKTNIAHDVSGTTQYAVWVRQSGALQKAETKAFGLRSKRENRVARFVVGSVADYKKIVIIVCKLERPRKSLAHSCARRPNELCHFGCEFRNK